MNPETILKLVAETVYSRAKKAMMYLAAILVFFSLVWHFGIIGTTLWMTIGVPILMVMVGLGYILLKTRKFVNNE